MKCEIFELSEISMKEALILINVGQKMGLSAAKISNNMHCIDSLLIHEKSKRLMVQRRCDKNRSKIMIDGIIEKFL